MTTPGDAGKASCSICNRPIVIDTAEDIDGTLVCLPCFRSATRARTQQTERKGKYIKKQRKNEQNEL